MSYILRMQTLWPYAPDGTMRMNDDDILRIINYEILIWSQGRGK